MNLGGKRALVTGGAGFIGSHLSAHLLETGTEVVVADDYSNGRDEWIPDGAERIEGDLTDREVVADAVGSDVDLVFHLAARKDPNDQDPRGQFSENTTMTHLLLEESLAAGVEGFAFASSSTVYGEAPRPTPEDHAPLEPISVYGAGKLGEEGLVSTYAHSHGLPAWTFRFANVVGPRLRGAVVPDFVEKLVDDPERLTILGDGRQEKSYVHVTDCVDAMCHVVERAEEENPDRPMHTYNLGTWTTTSVDRIADVVCDVLGVDPDYEYTGGDRGWTGDVPRMRLSIDKLDALGWEPTLESDEAVRRVAREVADEIASETSL
ncbi:NAD-dependent epimerase/dehydratase family protein [Natrarchaeobius oligotrophus]|uniref:NAD-dependent epimerase/dehydratase family protein n=1 Tax=Natrarchaeobius chitinivorans TaxID=1679083 RepID=A0A3N6MG47_NATCH|nr:NAD-dependent epimerase/dehydratase family protein [Natrarchaeobius chitinivorans]RQH01948.1 NAD-dependent epimerase/dehydratase family protein [Natrarchaeobius chitinivorans]